MIFTVYLSLIWHLAPMTSDMHGLQVIQDIYGDPSDILWGESDTRYSQCVLHFVPEHHLKLCPQCPGIHMECKWYNIYMVTQVISDVEQVISDGVKVKVIDDIHSVLESHLILGPNAQWYTSSVSDTRYALWPKWYQKYMVTHVISYSVQVISYSVKVKVIDDIHSVLEPIWHLPSMPRAPLPIYILSLSWHAQLYNAHIFIFYIAQCTMAQAMKLRKSRFAKSAQK